MKLKKILKKAQTGYSWEKCLPNIMKALLLFGTTFSYLNHLWPLVTSSRKCVNVFCFIIISSLLISKEFLLKLKKANKIGRSLASCELKTILIGSNNIKSVILEIKNDICKIVKMLIFRSLSFSFVLFFVNIWKFPRFDKSLRT